MNYNIEYNSNWNYKRVQDFEYSDIKSIEYFFEYTRNVLSDLAKFNAPVFARRVRRGFNFNDTRIGIYKDGKSFEILDDSIQLKRLNLVQGFIIHDNYFVLEKQNKFLLKNNKDYLISQKNNITNKFKLLFSDRYENITSINGIVTISQDIKKSFISQMYGGQKFIYANIFEWMKAKPRYDKITNFYDELKSVHVYKYLNKFDVYLLKSPDKILNVYKNIHVQDKDNILNKFDILLLKIPFIHNANIFKSYDINKAYELNANIYKNILLDKKSVNEGFVINEINIIKIPNIFNAHLNKLYSFEKEKVFDTYIQDYLLAWKSNKLSDTNKVLSGIKDYKYAWKEKDLSGDIIYNRRTYKNDILLANQKVIKKCKLPYKIKFFIKARKKSFIKNHIFSKKSIIRKTQINSVNKTDMLIYKFNHKRLDIDINRFLFKDAKDFRINNTEQFLIKDRKEFYINNTEVHLINSRKGIWINNTEKFIYKTRKGFIISNTEMFINNIKRPFRINDTELNLNLSRKSFNINNSEKFVYKARKSMYINNTELDLSKNYYLNNLEKYNNSLLKLPYNLLLNNNSIGFIVNANKKEAFYLELTRLDKKIKDLFLDKFQTFVESELKELTLDSTELWLFKNPKYLFETHSVMIGSLIKHIMIENDFMFLEKLSKDSIINISEFVYKNSKDMNIFKNYFVNTLYKKINIPNDIVFQKSIKEIYLQYDISITNKTKDIFIQNGLSVIKQSINFDYYNTDLTMSNKIQEVFITDNDMWLSKPLYGDIFQQYSLERKEYNMRLEQYNQDITRKEYDVNISDSIFISRNEYEMNDTINELLRMQNVVKELEKPVEHTYNWVWVYEPDNPLEPSEDYHGIDELLLPEKDVDYSSFEDYIFNKSKMVPRNPIKIIDDSTFIAKYPIKHPTPDYEEIGIVYIDVPSELMYKIFCKFYEVWYANVFKFGNMSMVDSLRIMLDYMYSWITLTYTGTEYLEPALRVFRQIRWFGEKSIMHNAQYLISYEKADLKCDLSSGILKEIDNDLDTNNTFYVNKTLGVIMTNSTYFRQDAYINLYLDSQVETVFTFNLRQAGGETRIYLDTTFVDVITAASKKVSITIPSGKHTLKIFRPALNNFATCYIGAITIIGGSFTNLQITYDPDLKLGNMPLNDVAQKMLELATLYDNEQEAFDRFRKGNLGVSQLYKELERYWELHHQNKVKGKRLTIKET